MLLLIIYIFSRNSLLYLKGVVSTLTIVAHRCWLVTFFILFIYFHLIYYSASRDHSEANWVDMSVTD